MTFLRGPRSVTSVAVPRVLIVSNKIPPDVSIGAQRVTSFARHLSSFGWEVALLGPSGDWRAKVSRDHAWIVFQTPGIDVGTALRSLTSYKLRGGGVSRHEWRTGRSSGQLTAFVKRAVSWMYDNILTFPDPLWSWWLLGRRGASRCAAEFAPDVLLSSHGPPSAHLLTSHLSRQLQIPWVADYRDLWTGNPQEYRSRGAQAVAAHLERRCLRHAKACVTVSSPLAEQLSAFTSAPVTVVENGWEPDEFMAPSRASERFTLLHAGTLYPQTRNPEPILAAVSRLIERGHIQYGEICLKFFGPPSLVLEECARKYQLERVIEIRQVSRDQAIQAMRDADVLLLLEWADLRGAGALTGKLFEYLGARRPILAWCHPLSAINEVIRSTDRGTSVSSIEEAEQSLGILISEWRRGGSWRDDLPIGPALRYSRRAQARRLERILRGACGNA